MQWELLGALIRPARFVACLAAVGILASFAAGDPLPSNIRAIAYPGNAAPLLATPCLYARDLPLIALMGANTVRTYGLLPEGDHTFLAVLESSNLNWLAGFPLDAYYNPSRTLDQQKPRILEAFRAYAMRFRGERRLTGYIFGNEVTEDYGRKFAGSPSDFFRLASDAAAILHEVEPLHTPALATAVRDAAEMKRTVPGLSFWCWNTETGQAKARPQASLPVLLSEDAEPAETVAREADLVAGDGLLGGVFASFSSNGETAIFHSAPVGTSRLDTLSPRPAYYRFAGVWGGTFPSSWTEKQAPQLNNPIGPSSAGGLVQFSGSALVTALTPYADESWPFHLAGTCLCVEGAPARLSLVSGRSLTAQIPAAVEPGSHTLVFYRAGQASNFGRIDISAFSTVTFAGPVLEARLRPVSRRLFSASK